MTTRAFSAALGSAAGIAAALLLTACASGSGSSDGGTPGASASAAVVDPVGTWTSTDDPEVFLGLGDDLRVAGKDGCNRLVGTWSSTDDNTVELGALASTMMYCEGVDTWLAQASVLQLDGSTAVVLDPDGARIGTLSRTD